MDVSWLFLKHLVRVSLSNFHEGFTRQPIFRKFQCILTIKLIIYLRVHFLMVHFVETLDYYDLIHMWHCYGVIDNKVVSSPKVRHLWRQRLQLEVDIFVITWTFLDFKKIQKICSNHPVPLDTLSVPQPTILVSNLPFHFLYTSITTSYKLLMLVNITASSRWNKQEETRHTPLKLLWFPELLYSVSEQYWNE